MIWSREQDVSHPSAVFKMNVVTCYFGFFGVLFCTVMNPGIHVTDVPADPPYKGMVFHHDEAAFNTSVFQVSADDPTLFTGIRKDLDGITRFAGVPRMNVPPDPDRRIQSPQLINRIFRDVPAASFRFVKEYDETGSDRVFPCFHGPAKVMRSYPYSSPIVIMRSIR